MMGVVRATRVLVAVAVFSIALQPCLACASDQGRPAMRPAESCHESTHQVATACPEVQAARIALAPTAPVGILAPLPASPEVVLPPQRSFGEAMVAPAASAEGPPLWLRHASLLV
jgi:hypothetical protein